jgi:hypothetical protein
MAASGADDGRGPSGQSICLYMHHRCLSDQALGGEGLPGWARAVVDLDGRERQLSRSLRTVRI